MSGIEIGGAIAMLVIGWFKKHRTTVPVRMTGIPTNAALAISTATVAEAASGGQLNGGDVAAHAVAIFAGVETLVQTGKWFWRLLKKGKAVF